MENKSIMYQPKTSLKKGGKEGFYGIIVGVALPFVLVALRTRGWLPWEENLDFHALGLMEGIVFGIVKTIRNFLTQGGFSWIVSF